MFRKMFRKMSLNGDDLRNELAKPLKKIRPAAPAIVLLALAAASPFWALAQKPVSPNVTEDLPVGALQAKATTACTECHEARIIIQQRLSKDAWTKEVDKMTKWGAVVDPADHDALVDYLSTNFSPDKPAYEPPLTSPDKGTGKTSM